MNDDLFSPVDVISEQPKGVGSLPQSKVPIRRIITFKITDERDNS